MRRCNSFSTIVIGCLTVAFVVLHKIIMIEPNHSSSKTAGIQKFTNFQSPLSNFRENLRSDNSQTHRYVTPSLAELGGRRSIPEMSEHTLMITRVPDAGVELLVLILQRLQGKNAFKHIRMPPGDDNLLTTLQQELLVEDITTIIRREAVPLTFDADVRFLNFSTFGRQAPTFISMVRDPLHPKILSRYYEKNDIIKTPIYCGSIAHFCGQDPRCTQENRTWALAEAQTNIERWYPVVGLLEHVEITLKALERNFPHFFLGATEVYSKLQVKKKSTKLKKPRITNLGRNHLTETLTTEVEFYNWLKSRLMYPKSGNG